MDGIAGSRGRARRNLAGRARRKQPHVGRGFDL